MLDRVGWGYFVRIRTFHFRFYISMSHIQTSDLLSVNLIINFFFFFTSGYNITRCAIKECGISQNNPQHGSVRRESGSCCIITRSKPLKF